MDTNRFVVGADEPLEGTVCGSPGAENDGRIGLLRTPFRCAIRPIIARRTDVGNNLVEVLSGVVRLALIAGVG